MNKKKNPNLVKLLFLFSCLLLFFCLLLIFNAKLSNSQLKNSVSVLQNKVITLESENIRLRMASMQKKERMEESALNYLEWQFVLKDQVNNVGSQLLSEINNLKDLKKDNKLLNLLYCNLGLSYTLALDFNSAIKSFEDAISVMPNDAESYYNLGLLYSAYRKDTDKAIKCYQKYLDLVPASLKAAEVKERLDNLKKQRRR